MSNVQVILLKLDVLVCTILTNAIKRTTILVSKTCKHDVSFVIVVTFFAIICCSFYNNLVEHYLSLYSVKTANSMYNT